MINNSQSAQLEALLSVNDVVDLLHQQYAIISGGKSKEGCPIITFPDNNNFHLLSDYEYQRLMLYLTSVPSLQEADMGFHLIIDRRKDRWNSVKNVLLKISVYFPGLIHVVYVIRPGSFLQKALSEVSNKLFKEEFKFRMIVLSTLNELYEYIDINQLTKDLGGKLLYSHNDWIQQRIEFENFLLITQQISQSLDEFTKNIEEIELPNNVDSTQQLLNRQTLNYSELKENILSTARHGENLLCKIKEKLINNNSSSNKINDIFFVERLLVQLEETEKTFDNFWQEHSTKLRHCLELRQFEQDFRELQINFQLHLKTCNDIIDEFGDNNIDRLDILIKETNTFEKLCLVDIERAEEVVSSGQRLMQIQNFYAIQCVEPKCYELIRIKEDLINKLQRRIDMLVKRRDFIKKIEMINNWCKIGLEILNAQNIELLNDLDNILKYENEINDFIKSAKDFIANNNPNELNISFKEISNGAGESKNYLTNLNKRIDEVFKACDINLKQLKERRQKLIIQKNDINNKHQPNGKAPAHPNKISKKFNKISKIESNNVIDVDAVENKKVQHLPSSSENNEDGNNKTKTGHVLAELLDTERVYVNELLSIITGYKMEAKSEDMQHLVASGFSEKIDIIFGNLDEIYNFHANVFLKDLEICISSIDLVALCFVQRKDSFYHLYSYYCQNISKSEELRENLTDCNMFFQACQKKLGHKLPLAAYLLKPVQRITKYQLLLKDLLRYFEEGKCCKELQQALDCMLVVLKCVNDSMHQISITGFPIDLSQQGELLLQGSFSVWIENKKDIKLRLKPLRRHIFLYQKSILFCKISSKRTHNKATYQFKHYLKMSQIGLTESVKGDQRKFEVWLQGRQEVYIIQASSIEQKQSWVNEIKRVLMNQLEELKGEKVKQYSLVHNSLTINNKPLRQTTSWEREKNDDIGLISDAHQRTISCDTDDYDDDDTHQTHSIINDNNIDLEGGNWSSDGTNSDDDDDKKKPFPNGRYIALSDYCAIGNSEVNMREGDMVELLKVGCAGWWFVKVIGSSIEGWAPAAYLENINRKTCRTISSKSQDKLNDH